VLETWSAGVLETGGLECWRLGVLETWSVGDWRLEADALFFYVANPFDYAQDRTAMVAVRGNARFVAFF